MTAPFIHPHRIASADMAHRWEDGVLYAPDGFLILARTGDDLRAWHCDTGRTARVSGAAGRAVQRELNYQCAKLLREIARAA